MLVKPTNIQGKGRALVASEPIPAGQILLRDRPILVYLSHHDHDGPVVCSGCYRKLSSPEPNAAPLLSCPSCSEHARFCSPNCQSSALASSHSSWVCKALTCLRSASTLSPDLRTQANFLIAAYNLSSVSPSDFSLLLSFQGSGVESPESHLLHSFILAVIALHPLPKGVEASPVLTALLLSKDKQNAFGIMEPLKDSGERLVRAYAIYPQASLFNHDCLPNACRFDYFDNPGDGNTSIIIRALHDIPAGREICLSYFPINWNYKDRQTRLSEDYGFTCNCDRCQIEMNWKDEDEEDMDEDEQMDGPDGGWDGSGDEQDFPHEYFFMKFLCERENCGGTLAPLPPENGMPSHVLECNVCGQFKPEEDEDSEVNEDDMLDE
ncbi:Histone-lysine N-methyltransferase [Nymphaea thermarum]|nr:Histone-lysine N-methyltransferase [Nymphaea thermarum]